ncbi:unnamed protein product [Effrenium voratum]|nr:unnamed protein product [Effrenium voratum]
MPSSVAMVRAMPRRLKVLLVCACASPAWLGFPRPRRSALLLPLLPVLPAFAEVHVVRPEEATDSAAFYTFDIPDSFEAVNRARYKRDRQLLGKTAEYAQQGARVLAGEAPEADFVKRRRMTVPRSQQKVLKYELGDNEDLLECVVKEPQEDGSLMLKHRWWRVLKEPEGRKAIMDMELNEDLVKDMGPQMEVIWGGQGTLMRTDEADFMRRWTPVVRQLAGPERMSGSDKL